MSAAALFTAAVFALPAGITAYLILTVPDHPRLDMRHLLAVIVLFGIPVVGIPEAAGAAVLSFGAGLVLTRQIRRWQHRQQTQPPAQAQPQARREPTPDLPPDPEPQPTRQVPLTDEKGQVIVFEDQLDE